MNIIGIKINSKKFEKLFILPENLCMQIKIKFHSTNFYFGKLFTVNAEILHSRIITKTEKQGLQ